MTLQKKRTIRPLGCCTGLLRTNNKPGDYFRPFSLHSRGAFMALRALFLQWFCVFFFCAKRDEDYARGKKGKGKIRSVCLMALFLSILGYRKSWSNGKKEVLYPFRWLLLFLYFGTKNKGAFDIPPGFEGLHFLVGHFAQDTNIGFSFSKILCNMIF